MPDRMAKRIGSLFFFFRDDDGGYSAFCDNLPGISFCVVLETT
jgi:hypothetical protein